MLLHALFFNMGCYKMIIDIPTKEDFYSSADDMVNEAWEKISNLSHGYYELEDINSVYQPSECFDGASYIYGLDQYWLHVRPKLISALTLVIQSIEFRLKGLIAGISPYLLLSSSSKNIPKPIGGIRSFSQFRSIDAQDLINVYETFSDQELSKQFKDWFDELRVLRNRFMHTVDKKSDISAELIFKSIVYAHKELNRDDQHWIWHRFNYKSKHSGEGVKFGADDVPGEIFEMLKVHYELTGAIHSCTNEVAYDLFGFDKEQESNYCNKCVAVMSKYEFFNSKHIDTCLGTVQKNRGAELFECVFCKESYNVLPKSIWGDDEFIWTN